jgi:ribosomal protein S6--L-glutamate ligase
VDHSPLRIAILSAGEGWHVRDLRRAAGARGHSADAIDFRQLHSTIGLVGAGLADTLEGYDGVLLRTMPPGSLEQVVFRMDLLHHLESRGVAVLNPPRAAELCIDKYLTLSRLASAGFRVPPTVVCQSATAALEAFAALGGDVVVKPLFGSEGRGMLRIQDAELAWRVFRALERTQAVLYLQAFLRHPGWDLRVFVLGGEVLAAMRRTARGDWRTNVAQGGRAEPLRPHREVADLAVAAAATLGTPIAGVDLLPGAEGEWYVLELNAVPGWRALAPVTGVDVAGAIIDHLVRRVRP